MRGWLAWINRSDDVRRQVPAYQELLRLFDFFARWHVVLFDEQAASEFQGLRAQPRTSLGACLSVSPGQEVQRRLVRFSDEDECRPLHNGRAGANEGDLNIFDLAFPRTS
jgi:hypothetical protein